MLNNRWHKRILRAAKTEVVFGAPDKDIVESNMFDRECEMNNCVKDNEKIMNYLQKDNASGHAHNLDMLLSSLNVNQHLRDEFLKAEVKEEADKYVIRFPFGQKTIEYKLSKKAIDG
jgi:hypothetical protein